MQDIRIVSDKGMRVELADYGARILDVQLPSDGGLVSVVCGYQSVEHYLHDTAYVGATIGPIANRIRDGKLTVGGRELQLPLNQNGHCLHSADLGFSHQYWEVIDQTASSVMLQLDTRDEVFGHLASTVRYSAAGSSLRIDYASTSALANYINLTNHAYWNLNTNGANVKNHEFELLVDGYAEKDADDIPTGVVVPLTSPFNYCPNNATPESTFADAVDHHFFSDEKKRGLKLLCKAHSSQSGISLLVRSTMAGFQLYSGHFLAPPLTPYAGFCVEPQYAPDAINITNFEAPLTTSESPFEHTIVYELSKS